MLESGTLLQNRYRILSQIGKGGMGTVYVARDENIGMSVAVKRNFLEEPRLIEAFKREARLLAGLRHPALPQVKDYFVDDTGQYLVMEYIAGDDLGTVLQKRTQRISPAGEAKPFDVQDVVYWAEQLLDALDYLHTRSEPVIHRDIKPLNLKLAERGQIILLDFGLAKGKPMWMTQALSTGSLYGYSPNYAPIEQIRGLGTDPRSDIYALGATLYHLLTGEPPIDAATRAESFLGAEPDPLPPPNRLNPKVPEGLSSLLMKAMEPHRNNRPSAAAEMLKMLRTARHSTVIDWQTWQREEKQRQQEQSPKSASQEHRGDADRTIEIVQHLQSNEPSEQAQRQNQQAWKPVEQTDRSNKQREAELRRREEEERKAREEAELRAREEAELRAREEAELRAREEEERRAREEEERRAREEEERRAREEAERQAREEAERKAREEAELRAREEAERRRLYEEERLAREAEILRLRAAQEERDRKAKEDAELAAREEEERAAREEEELREREEVERAAREQAELKAREQADRKAREEADRKAREEAAQKAKEEADRRRREFEEEHLALEAEILRLQQEQEERDRQETERLGVEERQQQDLLEEAKSWSQQETSQKRIESTETLEWRWDDFSGLVEERAHVEEQSLGAVATARPEAYVGEDEKKISTLLKIQQAVRRYPLIAVVALVVVLVLSILAVVLISTSGRKEGSESTGAATQSALNFGPRETPSRVLKVALSDDGRVLASAGEETTVRLWRPSGARELTGKTKKFSAVTVSHDGSVVATGTEDGTISLWRSSDGGILKTWRGHTKYLSSLAFSQDGQTLFSTGGDGSLRLWRASDGGSIADIKPSTNDLIVAVSAHRRLVGLTRQDGGVHLFYVSGDLLAPASDFKAPPVSCAEFSNDGEMIALGSSRGDVGLWRVKDGHQIKVLGKLTIKITSLAFSGNGQTLAAGLADGSIKLWRVSDGKLIKTLAGHTNSVNSLAFSADGRTLASGSDDKSVRVWNVEENQ